MAKSGKTKKPHIVLFFTWDVSLKLWKGKGLFEREIRYYEQLSKRGVKITFLTWGGEEDFEIAKSLKGNIDVLPLYTKLPRPCCKFLRACLSVFAFAAAAQEIKESDIIKTNQMWGAWCAVLAKLVFRKPLLLRTGFELYRFTILQGHGALRRQFTRVLSEFSYKHANKIYVASIYDKAFVQKEFGANENKIDIRPNWIDTETFKPLKTTEKKNRLLFVGRLTRQKNLPMLIEAVKDSGWILDIIGEGEEEGTLKKLVKKTNAKVNFLGSVPNTKLPKIYNSYPVFILPSDYEGNPKTLLEAMACGRAVIGTKVEGIDNVIKDGKNGILCERNAAELKRAIEKLLSNNKTREKIGTEARKTVIEVQSLDKLIDKELKDYKALTG